MQKTLTLEEPADFEVLKVLAVLLPDAGQTSMGVPENTVSKKSGLDLNVALKLLAGLIEKGFVTSKLCQKGTGGDMEHRYKLIGKSSVTVAMEVEKGKAETDKK
ncbi:hypothetical protein IH781_03235 [Patescibacteria group bacterium]|nr:hypothetical protein [Patescibacteria group bacterium]